MDISTNLRALTNYGTAEEHDNEFVMDCVVAGVNDKRIRSSGLTKGKPFLSFLLLIKRMCLFNDSQKHLSPRSIRSHND